MSYEFAGGKSIIWQGTSFKCLYARLIAWHGDPGTNGSVIMDRDGYTMYDLKNQVVRNRSDPKGTRSTSVPTHSTSVHGRQLFSMPFALARASTLRSQRSEPCFSATSAILRRRSVASSDRRRVRAPRGDPKP